MEQSPDSSEEVITGKLHELLDESDNEDCGQFCFQEETVEGVMQELFKEIAFPYSQTPSQVFVNDGKNGSCGASVSDTASTVMAGIEVVSPSDDFLLTEKVCTVVDVEEEKEMEVFDGGDFDDDDEWIGRVLSWSQQNQV
ncbi:hypothetical protein TanjilG_28259 [Lupinus angustifolius]|uniref:Uncharacterized protein n=1 Tax=Lupinus angustifolius TaxID=3871 RepID=A0A394DDF2_LUPAN|nr:hypothetical protein TanjilG_28259 [Lupinus angustifolius]